MNKRVKKLAEQAGCYQETGHGSEFFWAMPEDSWEKFAELIRADEREACAKLCDEAVKMNLESMDDISKTSSNMEGERIFIETAICIAARKQAEKLANGIRARGEVK